MNTQEHVDCFKSWKEELRKYWKAIDLCQEMYEFYKRENSETQSQIALNTPFAIVESMISKANDSALTVTVNAKGEKGLQELEKWISSILKNAIEDPDVAQYKGTFRKIREKFFREFLVKGNAIASVEWCRVENPHNSKKPYANNPYTKMHNLKSVIFNPTKTLCNSDKYYLESWVKYPDLKDKDYYTNLNKLKELAAKDEIEIEDETYYSDGQKITKKGEPIRILEVWEGSHYTVIANDSVIIRDEEDPYKIGGHNLIFAMNYVIGDRPYAYGEVDAIYKTVRAQDTIVNQGIDIVNRYLRPSILVNPQANVDLDELMDLIENGGVMEGNPEMVGAVPTNVPPTAAFQTVDTLQQAIERTSRYSPYSSGVPNAAVDKTSGTATGIMKMQQASEPNFKIKLDALEESFMQPDARIKLKMMANLMSVKDFRWGMLQGKSSEWVSAGKNVLMGKPTMQDLVTIGYTTPETALATTHMLQPTGELDEQGQPIHDIVPIPGADKTPVFDIDWLVDIRLDNQSAVDKEAKAAKLMSLVGFAQQVGVQVNPERTVSRIAAIQGEDDFEDLLLTEEEKQKAAEEAQMKQEQQMAQVQQEQEAQSQTEMQKNQMQHEQGLQKEQVKGQNQLQIENMRGQNAISKATSTVR